MRDLFSQWWGGSDEADYSVHDCVRARWRNATALQVVALCGCILTSRGAWRPCGAAESKYSTSLWGLARRVSDTGNSCGGRQSASWTTHDLWALHITTALIRHPRRLMLAASRVLTYETRRREDKMQQVGAGKDTTRVSPFVDHLFL